MTSQEIGAWALSWFRDLVVFFALGLFVIWLIPKPLNRWAEKVRQAPFKSFGAGIAVLVVGYIGIVIVFALILALGIFLYVIKFNDLGGIVIGLGLPATAISFGVLNVFVAFISKLVVAFLFGKLLLERFYKKGLAHNIWPLLLGLVVYLLIRAIPWLGWAFGSVVTLVGLGGIWLGLFPPKVQEKADVDPTAESAPETEIKETELVAEDAVAQVSEGATPIQPAEPLENSESSQPDVEVQAESEPYADPDPQSGD
jgi:hypothetical protein